MLKEKAHRIAKVITMVNRDRTTQVNWDRTIQVNWDRTIQVNRDRTIQFIFYENSGQVPRLKRDRNHYYENYYEKEG